MQPIRQPANLVKLSLNYSGQDLLKLAENRGFSAVRFALVSGRLLWIGPARPNQALTIAQACEFLHCGYDVVYRLLWKGLVHSKKRPIPGSRRPGWYIPVAELNRLRFQREPRQA